MVYHVPMQRITIKEVLQGHHLDKTITINGWVKTRRDSRSGISFIHLNDGSCLSNLQLVVPQELANYQTEILNLTSGCSISAKGKLVSSSGKNQAIEMSVDNLQVVGWVASPENYPIQPKRHTLEYLRSVAHLRPRTNTISAVARIRHQLSMSIHQFLHTQGFLWVHTPIITTSDCEGAGELFRVSSLDMANIPKDASGKVAYDQDFFGQEAFLTVSGQLNVEAFCMALSKVYTFGPTFRAENSNTSRHLAEFWMIEPEIAFADLQDVIALSTNMLQKVIQDTVTHQQEDFNFIEQFIDKEVFKRIDMLCENNFTVMTYAEAIKHLVASKEPFAFPVAWGSDLQSEHERYLCEKVTKKPTVITDYPKDIKSFYMRMNDDGKTVAAMDIIAPGIGEIIGGSQREERLPELESRMDELGIIKHNLDWYCDLRKYGTVPHAGFGLGLERLLGYITGIKNVRDLIPFPRTPGSANY